MYCNIYNTKMIQNITGTVHDSGERLLMFDVKAEFMLGAMLTLHLNILHSHIQEVKGLTETWPDID